MLDQIRIVLVETSHPGNIGGAARAMKNMCISDLVLVNPNEYKHGDHQSGKAKARAAGADDILASARIVDSLDAALKDCTLVVGASARRRTIPWPELTPKVFAEKAVVLTAQDKVAVVFGNETSGLDNDALDRCQYLLQIPANEQYSSLNLAAAVQVVCYELYQHAIQQPKDETNRDFPLANREEVERMYEHMEQTLTDIEFLDPKAPRQLIRRLRRLFNRAEPDAMEINILRGIFATVQQWVQKSSGKQKLTDET